MKLTNIKILGFTIIILLYQTLSTNVENHTNLNEKLKSQMKIKNSEKRTASEFFNELFAENSNLGNILEGADANIAKPPTVPPTAPPTARPTAPPTAPPTATPIAPPKAPITVTSTTSSINISSNNISLNTETSKSSNTSSNSSNTITNNNNMLTDWLMISSRAFKNSVKFPPVNLINGKQLEIKVDSMFFRINDGYNPHNKVPESDKYFWFRLSGSNLYYSSTSSDLNILGAVAVRFITTVEHVETETGNGEACFLVQDIDNEEWKLCASTLEIRKKWVCKLQKVLDIQQDSICLGDFSSNSIEVRQSQNILTKNIIQPVIIVPIPSPHCNEDWNYRKYGRDWNCDCSEGREQSPINLPVIEKAIESPIKPIFQYEEIKAKELLTRRDGQLKQTENLMIKYHENSLKINHQNMGKVVTLDGAIYYAQEIVIHTPAEHTIDGKKFAMELQIIHYGQTKGDIAKQVILSFLFEKKAGVYNKFIDDLDIFNLPNQTSKQIEIINDLFIPKILFTSDSEEVPFMKPFSFFTYQGSISFPPCTEKTIVYVASKPIPIGTTALQLLQEALRVPDMTDHRGNIYVNNSVSYNNREIQPTNGRPVFHYDHQKYCGPDPVEKKSKPTGHYEKVAKMLTQYYYVSDEKPSGIPGSYLVSENEALGKKIERTE